LKDWTALSRSKNRSRRDAGLIAGASQTECCWLSRESRSVQWGKEDKGGVHHQTVQRCVERRGLSWPAGGHRRIGRGGQRKPVITPEAKAWLAVAERWTRPRSTAIRMSCGRRGFWHFTPARHGPRRGTNVSPSWLRHGVERRRILGQEGNQAAQGGATIWKLAIAEFEQKMAEVLCVFIARSSSEKSRPRQVAQKPSSDWRSFSYDEKPGGGNIQAIRNAGTRLPPHPAPRDHPSRGTTVYKLHGTLRCWPESTWLTGKVHALVRGPPTRSRGVHRFIKRIDAAHRPAPEIKLILIIIFRAHYREKKQSLARNARPPGRSRLLSRPSMVRLMAQSIDGLFSKFARSVLAPNSGHLKKHGTQGTHHGRQSTTRQSHPVSTLGHTNSDRRA